MTFTFLSLKKIHLFDRLLKFATDIQDPQRMNCRTFGDAFSFFFFTTGQHLSNVLVYDQTSV